MKTAQCKINKVGLLIEACNLIDQMKIAEQNQDVQGDLYEYMLGHMQFAPYRGSSTGRGGQFRTPRHIIRMMGNVQEEFAVVVARVVVEFSRDIESLRGKMGESERQVEGLFESLLAQSFSN